LGGFLTAHYRKGGSRGPPGRLLYDPARIDPEAWLRERLGDVTVLRVEEPIVAEVEPEAEPGAAAADRVDDHDETMGEPEVEPVAAAPPIDEHWLRETEDWMARWARGQVLVASGARLDGSVRILPGNAEDRPRRVARF
jgi:hypothetical protein